MKQNSFRPAVARITRSNGEKGIDNKLFRVLGCIENFRGPDACKNFRDTKHIIPDRYGRALAELTGRESLENNDDVTATVCHGTDRLPNAVAGNAPARLARGAEQ